MRKQEILEEKKEEAKEAARELDDKPAGDQLGLDAEGSAGADAFGLLGKKGGAMIKLITREVDRSHAPADHGQGVDLTMMHSEMAKTGIDSGCSKMWGVDPGGNHGFSVADGDESDILATIAQHIPHVRFDVEPMRDLDDVMATLRAILQQVSYGEESHLRPGAEKCPTSSLIRADSQSTSSPEGQSPPQDDVEW